MVKKYVALYLADTNGEEPARIWLQSLKDKMALAKIMVRIARAEYGNLGDYKSVGHGVFELRIHYGPGYRVYFAIDDDKIFLLLFGGSKSSQSRDILTARRYWHQYKDKK